MGSVPFPLLIPLSIQYSHSFSRGAVRLAPALAAARRARARRRTLLAAQVARLAGLARRLRCRQILCEMSRVTTRDQSSFTVSTQHSNGFFNGKRCRRPQSRQVLFSPTAFSNRAGCAAIGNKQATKGPVLVWYLFKGTYMQRWEQKEED